MRNLQDLENSDNSADSSPPRIRGIGRKLRELRNISRQKAGLPLSRVETNFNLQNLQKTESGQLFT